MTSKIACVVIDATDPRALALFWQEVLGWEVVEDDGTGVSLAARGTRMPALDILRVPEVKAGKNRLHIDLRADGSTTAAELERLLALGARRVDVGQAPDATWVVLADPEGNEFCLLGRSVQELEAEPGRPGSESPVTACEGTGEACHDRTGGGR
jgi:predicted enzyme related to lactoylglutathione lyase